MLRIIFIIMLICLTNWQSTLAAESADNVGDFLRSLEQGGQGPIEGNEEVPQSLPGEEIHPEDMQKAFPTPLKQDAPRMDFIPNAAPLFPVIPLQESTQNNTAPSIQSPKEVPSPKLSTSKQNTAPNSIKIEPIKEAETLAVNKVKSQIDLKNPSLELMIGQMIMAGFTGGDLEKEAAILKLIAAGKVGGVFLVASPQNGSAANSKEAPSAKQENIYNPSQLRVLTATLQGAVANKDLPLFIAVEQEGGMVQSLRPDLGFAGLQAAAKLGQGSLEQTEIAARSAGLEMAGLGINFALGPAGDVNINPLSEDIGKKFRSFGPNPQSVAAHALAFGRGLYAAKVVPCLRNFPGTGSRMGGFSADMSKGSSQNLLYNVPDIGASWNNRELVPYAEAAKGGWQGAMQPAFVYHRGLDALSPVPLSRALLSGILRARLGFDGIVLSQDVRAMQPTYSLDNAVVQSVLAGVDIILVTEPAHLRAESALPQSLDDIPLESMLGGGKDLAKQLLQQSLGKAMPGMGFGMGLEQKIQTGHADEAAKVYNILLNAVKSGRIPMESIRNSWRRILKTKQEFLQNKVNDNNIKK